MTKIDDKCMKESKIDDFIRGFAVRSAADRSEPDSCECGWYGLVYPEIRFCPKCSLELRSWTKRKERGIEKCKQ